MSRFRTTGKISKSEPFAGLSIGRQIKNSAYGRFVDALTNIESIIPATEFSLKLPRVIVVGERSVGKSSLLENFTKCPVFPRGKGTCTKMPVRLQIKAVTSLPKYVATVRYKGHPDVNLTSTDGVLPAVQSIMDQAQGITADEITVEISQVTPCPLVDACQVATQSYQTVCVYIGQLFLLPCCRAPPPVLVSQLYSVYMIHIPYIS